MTDTDGTAEHPALKATVTPRGPLIFISHDSRDAALAEAFSRLLGSVSAGMLKSFRSSDKKGSQGFEYGVEWYPELMKTLESASDVVCLLTERGLGRPWMLYEAGVAKGKLEVPVHGLAIGVDLAKAGVGPFAQFQNCSDDVDSMTKLVTQLVQRLPHADPALDTVRAQVHIFKERVNEFLAEGDIDVADDSDAHREPSTAKLFEEIKVMFQDLPSRLEGVLDDPQRQRARLRRLHPGMIEEMTMMATRGERSPALAALITVSFFRDELPWLFEIAVEAYRFSMLGNVKAERRTLESLMSASEMVSHGPFLRDMTRGSKDLHMLLRDLPLLLGSVILAGIDPSSSH